MAWIYIPQILETLETSDSEGSPASQESMALTSVFKSGSEQSATSNGTSSVSNSSCSILEKASLIMHPSGIISAPSMESHGVEQWISSLEDSLVLPIVLLDEDLAAKIPEICGPIPSESFARFDQDMYFWRMSPGWGSRKRKKASLPTSDEFLETWPKVVMMQSRSVYELRMSVLHTEERGCLYWPTPDSCVMNDGESLERWQARREREKIKHRNGNGFGTPSAIAVRIWPTASARDWKDGSYCPNVPVNGLLGRAVWPTPQSRDWKGPQGRAYKGLQNDLPAACLQATGSLTPQMSLNPAWVTLLMGFPIFWLEIRIDDISKEDRCREILPALREETSSTEIQQRLREQLGILKESILQSPMHGKELCQRCAARIFADETSEPLPWDMLRDMWGYPTGETTPASSRRWESQEQLSREYPDLMHFLSCYSPSPCTTCWTDGSWENGVPRLSSRGKDRINKLKCLGNAVVPLQAKVAFYILWNYIHHRGVGALET